MKRSVIRVLDELVNLIVLVIVLILGGYGVYTFVPGTAGDQSGSDRMAYGIWNED